VSRSHPVAGVALAVTLAACSAATRARPGSVPAAATTVPTAPPTTTAPSTTSTTVDPGSLPQTSQLPSADDPAFRARLADLWQGITAGDPSLAPASFFPLQAYIQVKGISDPVHDYQTRLMPNFDQDIMAVHTQLGADPESAVLTGVTVPTAQWITPGVEYNKGSYWRVLGAEVGYLANGRAGSFEIHSMISWRGEWYVVHLGPIR